MSSIDTSIAIDAAPVYEPIVPETPANTSAAGFSSILADALKEQMKTAAITAGAGGSGGSSGLSGLGGLTGLQGYNMGSTATVGIEQAIMAAAASGEVSDAQVALFMLCMMMQGEQDGEFSMVMQMMASMITNLQGDTQTLRNDVMRADYSSYLLDTVDRNVFGGDMTAGSGAVLPVSRGRPTTPAITSSENNRSPGLYRAVINQFRVENAERYRPSEEKTYCNIFLWDVTSAMGAEIPHYVDAETGEPRTYPDVKGARELNAVAIDKWLSEHGEKYGWRKVDAETAQHYANAGKPAVTTAGSIGHVQVVCPSQNGRYDPARGVTIAQAGRRLSNYAYISDTYSAEKLEAISYFVHD